jgi:hypothetical protein
MTQAVLTKMNNKTSLQSHYLKSIKRQYIYSSIGDSEDVPVSGHNDAGLNEPSSFV